MIIYRIPFRDGQFYFFPKISVRFSFWMGILNISRYFSRYRSIFTHEALVMQNVRYPCAVVRNIE